MLQKRGALAFLRSFPGSAQGLISLPCSVVHFNPAHPPLLFLSSLPPSFRFVARRSFAGYTSRRAAGNGLTVGGEQLLPRKRFPSKLHLKNMIRLHSGGRTPDYRTDYVTSSLLCSSLSHPLTAFSAREFFLSLADRLLVARSASHLLPKLLLCMILQTMVGWFNHTRFAPLS